MSQQERKFMRLMVFFDLPVVTREQKRNYVLFRRFLIKEGYFMLQYSVYSRIINGQSNLEKYLRHIENNLPPEGNVRCMQVTEKQYAAMSFLVGTKKHQEKMVDDSQFLLF